MSKPEITFLCSHCGAQFQKWIGRCLECGKWGTVEKSKFPMSNDKLNPNDKNNDEYAPIKTSGLNEIEGKNVERIKTSVEELDRALGGGLVPGSLILLGGEPGIGKSTLALQLAALLQNTTYISGEESVEQIKLRAERLKIKSDTLRLGNATSVESIIATIRPLSSRAESRDPLKFESQGISPLASKLGRNDSMAIIDSIQTIHSDEVEGEAGNVSQVRACTVKLMELAKSTRTTIVLIGQVTKDGAVA